VELGRILNALKDIAAEIDLFSRVPRPATPDDEGAKDSSVAPNLSMVDP
jgi:hypothetical protein